MPRYRREHVPGCSFFFTVNLLERRQRLPVDRIDDLQASFRAARAAQPFEAIAIVILLDHLHCVWRLPEGDGDNAGRLAGIRSCFCWRFPRLSIVRLSASLDANAACVGGVSGNALPCIQSSPRVVSLLMTAFNATGSDRRSRATRFPIAFISVPLLCAAWPASANLTAEDGLARDLDSNRLLYREAHLIRREGARTLERLVLYRCPNGVAFARKRVDYRGSAFAPEFDMVDVRGYREGLRREGGQTLLWTGTKAAKALAATKSPLVADAGFDEFMRQQWAPLTAGRPQPLAFAVPAYGRSLPLKVRSTGTLARDGDRLHRFELRFDGLLGLVASTIRVEYDTQDQRLRRFTGLTNIRDAGGEQIEAEIDFPQPPRAADAQRWQAALTEPLARCTLGG